MSDVGSDNKQTAAQSPTAAPAAALTPAALVPLAAPAPAAPAPAAQVPITAHTPAALALPALAPLALPALAPLALPALAPLALITGNRGLHSKAIKANSALPTTARCIPNLF
ncbi:hypothetical protein FHG87_007135 [Trinorchestia longiramus]|nr:hypothetical protein FHG87_007135 [Trinorchestia longiramus]